jgi:hypothetical protein
MQYNSIGAESNSKMKSFIDSPKKATFCFGAGREHFNRTCTNEKLYTDPTIPGPGSYTDSSRNIGVQARKMSLHGKIEGSDPATQAIKRNMPGPGTYKV